MVPPCFESAESISDVGLPQSQTFRGFLGFDGFLDLLSFFCPFSFGSTKKKFSNNALNSLFLAHSFCVIFVCFVCLKLQCSTSTNIGRSEEQLLNVDSATAKLVVRLCHGVHTHGPEPTVYPKNTMCIKYSSSLDSFIHF